MFPIPQLRQRIWRREPTMLATWWRFLSSLGSGRPSGALEQRFLRDVGSGGLRRGASDRVEDDAGDAPPPGPADPTSIFERVARLMVPTFADWCMVHLVDDDRIRPVAVAHVDPAKVDLVRRLATRCPSPLDAPRGIANVLRDRNPHLVRDASEIPLVEIAPSTEQLELLRSLRPSSYVCLPIEAMGRLLGTMTCAYGPSRRRYGSELRLMRGFVQSAALAVECARRYDDAQAAIRIRDEVLATVSHDLKSPLQTIASVTDLLDADRGHDPQTKAVAALRRAHVQASNLVNDLVDAMRLRAGKMNLDLCTMQVGALFDEIEMLYGATADAKRVQLTVHRPRRPLELRADPRRMLQLLGNLVSNAIKHTPRGASVDVHVEDAREGVRFRVIDDGPGIPADDRQRVFEPFWQASANSDGAGLGLSIARMLADAHGARIWVDNDADRGAVFGVAFPAMGILTHPRAIVRSDGDAPPQPDWGSRPRRNGIGLAI